jgi:hypothetical protein
MSRQLSCPEADVIGARSARQSGEPSFIELEIGDEKKDMLVSSGSGREERISILLAIFVGKMHAIA